MCFAAAQSVSRETAHNFYEDDRIRVFVPAGWTATSVMQTTTGDEVLQVPIGGVFSKGKYRVYLLTHFG